MKVGDTVWFRYGTMERGDSSEMHETEIVKIGRKYIYVKEYSFETAYHIDTMMEKIEYGVARHLYLSIEDREIELERARIASNVISSFSTRYKLEAITLEALRKIEAIIDEYLVEK